MKLAVSSKPSRSLWSSAATTILFVLSLSTYTGIEFSDAFAPSIPSSSSLTSSSKQQNNYYNNIIRHAKKEENDQKNNDNDDENLPSWYLPSDHPESAKRRQRLVRFQEEMMRFKHGTELENLRTDLVSMKENLKWALATDDIGRIIDLTAAIEKAQEKDPEFVYARALRKIDDAQKMNVSKKYHVLPKITEEALSARQHIPRLNMEGLWLGNFGAEGSGLINVTYTGDTLIATKVTGECNIPKNEVLFRANLFSEEDSGSKKKPLNPITLTGQAASKWKTDKLERYEGEGQLASEDYKDHQFVEGQLIMFDGYFSFLYLPTKQHIFFSRPSAELTLHLMRDLISVEDKVQNMKDHLNRCFEKEPDDALVRPSEKTLSKPLSRKLRKDDLLASEEDNIMKYEYEKWLPRSSKDDSRFSFWAFHKWMNYIDTVLKPSKGNDGFA